MSARTKRPPVAIAAADAGHAPSSDAAATTECVRRFVAALAAHHHVTVLDEAVRAAVELSRRYLPAPVQPDAAIGLLDAACARVSMAWRVPPAAIGHLRQFSVALRTELDLLEAEDEFAPCLQARSDCMAAIQAELASMADQITVLERRWQDELATAGALPASEAGEDRPARVDAPCLFSQVDEDAVAAVVADWTGIARRLEHRAQR